MDGKDTILLLLDLLICINLLLFYKLDRINTVFCLHNDDIYTTRQIRDIDIQMITIDKVMCRVWG